MTIALQNRQNLPSPSQIFASILQVRQAPRNVSLSIIAVQCRELKEFVGLEALVH